MVDKHVNKYLMEFIYDSLELKYYKHKVRFNLENIPVNASKWWGLMYRTYLSMLSSDEAAFLKFDTDFVVLL
jgi:hypothetical protein